MNRILLMLAGSGLSKREISKDLRDIFDMDEGQIHEIIAELRHLFFDESRSRQMILSENFEIGSMSLEKTDRKLGEQISQMLRDDVGLTTDEASEYLLSALKKYLPPGERPLLPSSRKESFVRWVQRLSTFIPPSVLLHEAAKLRNRLAHTSKSDWPLNER